MSVSFSYHHCEVTTCGYEGGTQENVLKSKCEPMTLRPYKHNRVQRRCKKYTRGVAFVFLPHKNLRILKLKLNVPKYEYNELVSSTFYPFSNFTFFPMLFLSLF